MEPGSERPEDETEPGPRERGLASRIAALGESAIAFDEAALYRGLLDRIPAVVYLDPVGADLGSIYISPHIEELIGVTPQQWLEDQTCWSRHVHPDDLDRAWDEYSSSIERDIPLNREYRMIHEDGTVRWVMEQAHVVPDASGRSLLIQGVIVDITARKDADDLAFLAYHDKLTSLPNRALFEEMLALAIGRSRRSGDGVALLFMDLDNFKQVNDTMGHHAGDKLLVMIADRLRPCLREVDVFARRSGDEFLILLSDIAGLADDVTEGAVTVARRIEEALSEPFDLLGTLYVVSASTGISRFPHDAADISTLLKHADEAMYQAKRIEPGAHVVYRGAVAQNELSSNSMADRIARAVREEAWVLHWLPTFDLLDGSLAGVEALIRWRDPNGGLVPPGEFLPIAEELGLIEAIGEWVVEELCRQDGLWRADGLELPLSFNLSPRQLWSARLSEKLIGRLRAANVDPRRVTLEIGEATAMADPERAQKVFYELRAWGLNLAIDDYGGGHASLARLKNLPADVLKIDRSFVRGVNVDPDQSFFVKAVISLATSLAMVPAAIGVETQAEADFLRDLGCRYAQGFHFSRPVAGDQIPALALAPA